MSILRHIIWLIMLAAWTSNCSAHPASGAYINQGQNFVELLQLTVKADGNLDGTFTSTQLEASGALSQSNASIMGSVDGDFITIVIKASQSFLSSQSLSGTFDSGLITGGVITLSTPEGLVRYTASNATAYQTSLQKLRIQSAVIKLKQQAVAAETARQRRNFPSCPSLYSYVTDKTGTLDDAMRASLKQRLQILEQRQCAQLGVLVVASTAPDTIERYSGRVFAQWKQGHEDISVLLIVAKNDRALRIEVGYGLQGVISDATASRIINERIVPRFKIGDYAGGINAGVTAIDRLLDGALMLPPTADGAK